MQSEIPTGESKSSASMPALAALPAPSKAACQEVSGEGKYTVGTLRYTTAGLVAMFAWLLWGDLCFYLHEYAVGGVMPLVFKRHNAPNWLMGLMLTSLPAMITFTLMPLVSTASDRTRTRLGRRMPYLIIGAPVNALFLILLAFSEDFGKVLAGSALARAAEWSPEAVIVAVVALALVCFRLTDIVVASVYYYLFNDVVPKVVMARFLALFRVVGVLTAAGYNAFIYGYSETHMREICLGAGVVYLIGYTLMCVKVKEGQYDPPPVGMERKGVIASIGVYFRECFTHRFYWYFFLFNGLLGFGNAIGAFVVFLQRDSLGLTLEQIGRINSVSSLVAAALLYFAGIMADRVHPLRFMLLAVVLEAVWGIAALNWLFWDPTPQQAMIVTIILTAGALPLGVIHTAAGIPMTMALLPKERLGQFWAANGMVAAAASLLGGVMSGHFLDLMKKLYGGSDFGYRFVPVWQLAGMLAGTCMLYLLYREWVKLGGRKGFVPPGDTPEREAKVEGVAVG